MNSSEMTVRLINGEGDTVRNWETDNESQAMTADRNCPVGWSVTVSHKATEITNRRNPHAHQIA